MKQKVIIVGGGLPIAAHALAELHAQGIEAEIIEPEQLPKSTHKYRGKEINVTLEMPMVELSTFADGRQSRRERRAKERKKTKR